MYFSKIFSVCSLSTYFGNLKEAPGIDRGRGVTALLQLSHALPVTGRSLVMAYNLITRGACQRFSLWSFSLDWFLNICRFSPYLMGKAMVAGDDCPF